MAPDGRRVESQSRQVVISSVEMDESLLRDETVRLLLATVELGFRVAVENNGATDWGSSLQVKTVAVLLGIGKLPGLSPLSLTYSPGRAALGVSPTPECLARMKSLKERKQPIWKKARAEGSGELFAMRLQEWLTCAYELGDTRHQQTNLALRITNDGSRLIPARSP